MQGQIPFIILRDKVNGITRLIVEMEVHSSRKPIHNGMKTRQNFKYNGDNICCISSCKL